jgi:hypothetical protein
MKARRFSVMFIGVMVVMLAVVSSKGFSETNLHVMEGKISAVSPEYNTVVVEVPVGQGKLFTVGGPLVPDAVLIKEGERADLEAFSRGDEVTVTWRSVPDGHVIERLVAE